MRNIIGFIFFLTITGCASNLSGVGIPSPNDISGFYGETVGISNNIQAGDYIIASIAYTNQKCEEFFIELEKVRQGSEVTDKLINVAVAAGAPLLAFGNSKETVSEFTSILTSVNSLNKAFADVYLLSSYTGDLKRLVLAKMNVYLEDRKINESITIITGQIPPKISGARWKAVQAALKGDNIPENPEDAQIYMRVRFLRSSKPTDLLLARNIATGYAAICSLQSLRAIVGEALAVGKVATVADKVADKPVAPPIDEKTKNVAKSTLSTEQPTLKK